MQSNSNLGIYRDGSVVSYYDETSGLSECEQEVFTRHLKKGMDILDLGVGGGRTTPLLKSIAGNYTGIDYSPEMVEVCKRKFPELRFEVVDASKMDIFDSESFDAVVFSFNGLDNLSPDEQRHSCLRECYRLLRNNGVLIFSSHNAKSFLMRPTAKSNSLLMRLRLFISIYRKNSWPLRRARRRILSRAFWTRNGYVLDSKGLLTHVATPDVVIRETVKFGFEHLSSVGEDYPAVSNKYFTRWYYYVFAKAATGK